MDSIDKLMQVPLLESKHLILRPFCFELHCNQIYLNWLNDPEVNRYLEISEEYNMETLSKYIKDSIINSIFIWAIHIKENNKHIGNIKIDPINYRHGFGEYGIMMGDRIEWGKGYAREASLLVIDFCFHKLKLRKINLGVVSANTSAMGLYQKLGFVIEGTYKRHGYYDNKLQDLIRMALFNQE